MRSVLAGFILVGSWAFGPAQANVYLNELTVQPAGASESVELYNSGGTIDISGWKIRGNKGTYVIPSGTQIPGGGYLTLSVGDIQDERGGITSLIDLVPRPGMKRGRDGARSIDVSGLRLPTGRDSVYYGQEGSAPLPPAGFSLARAPDASLGPPPPPDPATDGLVWTVDPTPTFGRINDVPPPQMGSSVTLNELYPQPVGGGDGLELYNPTHQPVNVAGWAVLNGTTVQPLYGVVPAGGFLALATDQGFDEEAVGLLYLFRADQVRVDQLGFWDGPVLGSNQCYARCPDGSPPFLGYDWTTSGGGATFLVEACTLGASNAPCPPSSVPEPPPNERATTWGRIKGAYR